MKITTSYLKRLIKEEVQKILLSEQTVELADFDGALAQLTGGGAGHGVDTADLDAAMEQFKKDMIHYPRSQPGRPSVSEYLEVFSRYFDEPEKELLNMLPPPDPEYMSQRAREAEEELAPHLGGETAMDRVQKAGDTVIRLMRQYEDR